MNIDMKGYDCHGVRGDGTVYHEEEQLLEVYILRRLCTCILRIICVFFKG